ncbi:MAG: hypothetical protein R3B91_16400 [Planctomycetaceae bacterium]
MTSNRGHPSPLQVASSGGWPGLDRREPKVTAPVEHWDAVITLATSQPAKWGRLQQ